MDVAKSQRTCDLFGETIPSTGSYGSGSLTEGLSCSLTYFALRGDQCVHALGESAWASYTSQGHDS